MVNTNKLFHLLYQKTRLMTKELNEFLQPFGLYSSQWAILSCLKNNGPMIQSEIWRQLVVEAPTVTRTIMKLEASGWVERSQGIDKRERVVSLTAMAINQLPIVEKEVERFEAKMIEQFNQEELDSFYSFITKIGLSTTERKG
ncbi:MarR family winged helix-turn-helix transcriptional regulator [Metabacillus malikii]|uniref:DNA-binding MarR family transcriptional regulator n=1 Tax=Metabacillus malikii TaxID=1504265 RepID=A0ABT9ZH09_9BACI|nr:MarR family transcriptional regulator [Metabacillus malikii]MDQ0230823.1 DNA-binding MarR family transcriptional regulator [Metabacillus malikii]